MMDTYFSSCWGKRSGKITRNFTYNNVRIFKYKMKNEAVSKSDVIILLLFGL